MNYDYSKLTALQVPNDVFGCLITMVGKEQAGKTFADVYDYLINSKEPNYENELNKKAFDTLLGKIKELADGFITNCRYPKKFIKSDKKMEIDIQAECDNFAHQASSLMQNNNEEVPLPF